MLLCWWKILTRAARPGYIGQTVPSRDSTPKRSSLMRGLQLARNRSVHSPPWPSRCVVFLIVALISVLAPAVASAATGFTEQIASARWLTPFQCPDGSTAADGRMIVETDNFIEAG